MCAQQAFSKHLPAPLLKAIYSVAMLNAPTTDVASAVATGIFVDASILIRKTASLVTAKRSLPSFVTHSAVGLISSIPDEERMRDFPATFHPCIPRPWEL